MRQRKQELAKVGQDPELAGAPSAVGTWDFIFQAEIVRRPKRMAMIFASTGAPGRPANSAALMSPKNLARICASTTAIRKVPSVVQEIIDTFSFPPDRPIPMTTIRPSVNARCSAMDGMIQFPPSQLEVGGNQRPAIKGHTDFEASLSIFLVAVKSTCDYPWQREL